MFASEFCTFSWWWIVPLIMMVMMVLCFVLMRGRRGPLMCGFGWRGSDPRHTGFTESPRDILDRRYASGEIDKDEYEEKLKTFKGSSDSASD